MPWRVHEVDGMRTAPSAASASLTAASRARATSSRAPATNPSRAPTSDIRTSALSARRLRRYSARELNMRYGSEVPRLTRSSTSTPRYDSARPVTSGSPGAAALAPASRPCAAASSYPVVPLICPARYSPATRLVSRVERSSRGSMKSYSTPYPGTSMTASSSPGMVRSIASWWEGSMELEMPLGYTTWVPRPSGSSHTRWVRPGKRRNFISMLGQ
mmetsp:Transcript_18050/g.58423  ORF Transcript_18050/g.58423 Transcript_18050/m.58423 type:complete len:216 (-) Transcript_18050:1038-1685(-)